MAFKVKVKVDSKSFKKKIERFTSQAIKVMSTEIKTEILKEIEGGRSPVKGQKRFQKYSSSYLNAISKGYVPNKMKRPVNLKVSGDLLKSLFSKSTKNEIKIGFDNELFDIHNNKGAGKSKVIRRMLPTKQGETFSRSITLRIREIVSDVKKSIFG